jgi:hypothetical protein
MPEVSPRAIKAEKGTGWVDKKEIMWYNTYR